MEKNSSRRFVLAVELIEPAIVVPVGELTADVITGKFCSELEPVSASSASFAVTPLLSKSMPSPPLP